MAYITNEKYICLNSKVHVNNMISNTGLRLTTHKLQIFIVRDHMSCDQCLKIFYQRMSIRRRHVAIRIPLAIIIYWSKVIGIREPPIFWKLIVFVIPRSEAD